MEDNFDAPISARWLAALLPGTDPRAGFLSDVRSRLAGNRAAARLSTLSE